MRKPSVKTRCVANRYSTDRQRIIEFSSANGGGLISFHLTDKELLISPYRLDKTVRVVNRPLPAIRFIVDTYTSERDRNGNCHHWSRITSTVTGRTLALSDVGGERNTPNEVYRAIEPTMPEGSDPWGAMHYAQHVIPRKQWRSPQDAVYCVTAAKILDLEQPEEK